MTKKEMAVVLEALDAHRDSMQMISNLFDLEHGMVPSSSDSPFGKIDNLLELFYMYIPEARENGKVEDRMYALVLFEVELSIEERVEALVKLRRECGGNKRNSNSCRRGNLNLIY